MLRITTPRKSNELPPNVDVAILEEAEEWISDQMAMNECVSVFDLLENFDVDTRTARLIMNRFESRQSTQETMPTTFYALPVSPYDNMAIEEEIWDIEDTDAKPVSSTLSLPMLRAPSRNTLLNNAAASVASVRENILASPISPDHLETNFSTTPPPTTTAVQSQSRSASVASLSPLNFPPTQSQSPHIPKHSHTDRSGCDRGIPSQSQPIACSSSWFHSTLQKHIKAIQDACATFGLHLPPSVAERIAMDSVILPGAYVFTGVLFPPERTESDLFNEFAQSESGYKNNKAESGLQFKRRKPKVSKRLPENNTASLWLDEDGSICGFRCVWTHGARFNKLILDQRYNVVRGVWNLNGEISISLEQFFAEDVFTGYLQYDVFNGEWNAGNEFFGTFQFFIVSIKSYYLDHKIEANKKYDGFDNNSSPDKTPMAFDPDSDGGYLLPLSEWTHILQDKICEIEINDTLTIILQFVLNYQLLIFTKPNDWDSDDLCDPSLQIGTGVWTADGICSFSNIQYTPGKSRFYFHGCTDADKLVGRLCMYYDNTADPTNDKKKKKEEK